MDSPATNNPSTTNQVRRRRMARGWSQAELARRAGISRAAVSAIEIERLVPAVTTALALAQALGETVESLFGAAGSAAEDAAWAWTPTEAPCRYWEAQVEQRCWRYPAEMTAAGELPHDGLWNGADFCKRSPDRPAETLVLATCDPAAGLLAAEYNRATPFRLLPLARSSGEALRLLGEGLVHAAGVHLAAAGAAAGNALAVSSQLGSGYQLLRMAEWEEGLAISSRQDLSSVASALRSRLHWVGREPGSGARQCLDELLADRRPPRRIAYDHRGVATAIRSGWADAGVCLRLVSEEAGLRFLSVRSEHYELCFRASAQREPRIKALLDLVRTPRFRRLFGELPGYRTDDAGELTTV